MADGSFGLGNAIIDCILLEGKESTCKYRILAEKDANVVPVEGLGLARPCYHLCFPGVVGFVL